MNTKPLRTLEDLGPIGLEQMRDLYSSGLFTREEIAGVTRLPFAEVDDALGDEEPQSVAELCQNWG